jgi:hypothetical protein
MRNSEPAAAGLGLGVTVTVTVALAPCGGRAAAVSEGGPKASPAAGQRPASERQGCHRGGHGHGAAASEDDSDLARLVAGTGG